MKLAMDDAPIDLKKLAKDAQREVRTDIRASKWCRLMHDWTRWERTSDTSSYAQTRWCIGCGKLRLRFLSNVCHHLWSTDVAGPVYDHEGKFRIGHYYDQTCELCSEKRRKTVRT